MIGEKTTLGIVALALHQPRRRSSRRGHAIILVTAGLTLFTALCSLAVDWGRVTLIRTELQSAADAAARAAAGHLDDEPVGWAVRAAAQNQAGGTPVVLTVAGTTSDVELGLWDAETSNFTPNATTYDAVRVTAHRTAARGNAVSLWFARLVGFSEHDVVVSAVAATKPIRFGVVGLDGINMNGNASMGFLSASGVKLPKYGSIASNGNINLGGSTYIYGDAYPGIGKVVYGPERVAGSTKPLNHRLSFDPVDGSVAQHSNNNGLLPSFASSQDLSMVGNQSLTLPAGTYYFRNISIGSNSVINCLGSVKIYCWGTFDLKGTIHTAGSSPGNLSFLMCEGPSGQLPGLANIGSNSALYMTVYAPLSAVTMSGTGDIYGSVLGKTINMTGTSAIHYDIGLEGGVEIRLVR